MNEYRGRPFMVGDPVTFPAGDDVAGGGGCVYWLYPDGNTLVQLDDGAVILRQRDDLQHVEWGPELLVRKGSEGRALVAWTEAGHVFRLFDPIKAEVVCSGDSAVELESALLRLGYWVDRAHLDDALAAAVDVRHSAAAATRPSSAAVAMGRRGGVARAVQLTSEERSQIARKGGLSGGRGRNRDKT